MIAKRTPWLIDARLRGRTPMPGPAAPAPLAPLPETLASDPDRAGDAPALSGVSARPVAMPRPVPGTRTTQAELLVLVACDESGSTGATDPHNARWSDTEFACRWMAKHYADDRLALAAFDDEVALGPPQSPRAAAREAATGFRGPGMGGTAYVPVVEAAAQIFARHPNCAHLLVVVTDGMSSDVAECAQLLERYGMQMVLIPFGDEFPWIAANWEHAARVRLAEHVGDRPRAIAQTLALAIVDAAGQQYRLGGDRGSG